MRLTRHPTAKNAVESKHFRRSRGREALEEVVIARKQGTGRIFSQAAP